MSSLDKHISVVTLTPDQPTQATPITKKVSAAVVLKHSFVRFATGRRRFSSPMKGRENGVKRSLSFESLRQKSPAAKKAQRPPKAPDVVRPKKFSAAMKFSKSRKKQSTPLPGSESFNPAFFPVSDNIFEDSEEFLPAGGIFGSPGPLTTVQTAFSSPTVHLGVQSYQKCASEKNFSTMNDEEVAALTSGNNSLSRKTSAGTNGSHRPGSK